MRDLNRCSSILVQLLGLALFAGSCSDGSDGSVVLFPSSTGVVDSTQVDTSDISARIRVTAAEAGDVEVLVELERSIGPQDDRLELVGESLVARFDGVSQSLGLDPSDPLPSYLTVFQRAVADGTVEVSFFRADGSVIDLSVILRPEFDVTGPLSGQVLDIDDELFLSWSPAEPGRVVQIRGTFTCLTATGSPRTFTFFRQVADDGSDSLEPSQLAGADDPDIDRTRDCSLEVRFERPRETLIVPPFRAGRMESIQRRTVDGVVVRYP